jgi:hypothetical protein
MKREQTRPNRREHHRFAGRPAKSAYLADFLARVNKALFVAVAMAMLQFCLPAAIEAQALTQPPTGLRVISSDSAANTHAVQAHAVRLHAEALTVSEKCDYSEDGVTFSNFERGHIFEQGAVLRTGDEARTDLFFRRSGTTVRLQPGTEIKLERISTMRKDDHPSEHVILDLRTGSIFAVVRPAVTGSTLEISNAAGRSVVAGSGGGGYIITADGTNVSAFDSLTPIKLISENGITTIAAGQQFTKQDGKISPLSLTSRVKDLNQLDELKASTDELASGNASPRP